MILAVACGRERERLPAGGGRLGERKEDGAVAWEGPWVAGGRVREGSGDCTADGSDRIRKKRAQKMLNKKN